MSEIEEIGDLNSQDVLVIKNLGRQGGRDIDKTKFKGKQNFGKLHLYWSSLDDDDDIALHDDYVMVLEGLQPQPNLKVLGIHGFSGLKLPKDSLSYYLPNLVELHIENCERCLQLPALGMLPCLKVLNISGMKSVKRLGKEFYYQQEADSGISLFRSLTELSLTDMPILEEWLDPPSPYYHNSFPSLKSLIISGCVGLKSIPLSSCSSLESLKLQNTTDEAVNSILDSKGVQGLNSLTSVSIQDSPQLIFFPVEVIQSDTRIQSLEILDCYEFLGFRILNNSNYDKTNLSLGTVFNNSSISSLRSLKLSDCPALMSLPDLRKWTSLTELRIENCDKLKKSFPYDLASLHILQTLYVDRFIDVSSKLGEDTNESTVYRIHSVTNLIMYLIVLGIIGGLLIFGRNARGATRPYHWDSVACTLLAIWAIYFFGKHGNEFIGILLKVLKGVNTYRRSWDLPEKEKPVDTQVLAVEQDNEEKGENLGLTKYLDTNFKGPAYLPKGLVGISHQEALAQVTAQASQFQFQPHIQAEYPSSAAPPAVSYGQHAPFTFNSAPLQQISTSTADLKSQTVESSEVSQSDYRSQPTKLIVDKPADDGYNWRKYGERKVEGSDYPHSYYKCTYQNCVVKKKVERSLDGQVTEIIHKGQQHNHQKPQPRKHVKESAISIENINFQGNLEMGSQGNNGKHRRDLESSQATDEQLSGPSDNEEVDGAESIEYGGDDDEPEPKIISREVRVTEQASHRADDGYRWRKYGQKVVKGNDYPRSYYKCTFLGCNVRKHVERAATDPKAVITTYEGKHNHDVPVAKNSSHDTANQLRSQNTVVNNRIDFGNSDQQPVALGVLVKKIKPVVVHTSNSDEFKRLVQDLAFGRQILETPQESQQDSRICAPQQDSRGEHAPNH